MLSRPVSAVGNEPSVYKDQKDDPVHMETMKSGRSRRRDGWSDGDESEFLD